MKWNKKISIILSLFFISSLILVSSGYAINTTSNDIDPHSNGLADSPWPRYRGNNQGTGLSPYNTSFLGGIEKWNLTLDGEITSSPVIGPGGTIYVGSDNRSLYAISQKGSLKWKADLRGNISNSPSIGESGTIYVTLRDGSGELCAFDEDGERLWNVTPEQDDNSETQVLFEGSPVINSNKTIFISTHSSSGRTDGQIYAVSSDGTIKWEKEDANAVSPLVIGPQDNLYYASSIHLNCLYPNGTKRWKKGLSFPGAYRGWPSLISSPMISSDGTIYILGGVLNDRYPFAFISLRSNGNEKWVKELEGLIFVDPTLGPDGSLYYGNYSGVFNSLNENASEKWSVNLEGKLGSSPAAGSDGTVYVNTYGKGKFYAISQDGSIKWSITKRGNFTSPAIGSDGTVYVGNEDGKLYALGSSSPVVNITSPKQKEIYNDSVTVEWEGSTVGTDIDHYEVKLDNESWTDVVKETSYKLDDLEEGKHVIKVKAVARSGNYDIDSIEITVNKPPEINITAPIENEIFNTSTVTVEWISKDESGIDHHEIQLDAGNWNDVYESTEYTFEELSDDEHIVRVKAVDNTGNSIEKSVNFTVDTTPPTADAGEDIEVGISEQFTLDGTGSTDNTEIESFRWMINGETYNKKVVNLSIDETGEYTAELTVIDIAGNTGTDTATVTVVDNGDPTADAGEDRTVKVDEEITFDASDSSDNLEITSYEWDFDDGSTANGETVTHKFDEKGTYEVTLTVTDEAGNEDTDTVTVTVEKKDDNDGIPGFTIFTAILGIYLAVLYKHKRRNM